MVRFALIGIGSMGKKYAMMFEQGEIKDATLTAVVCRSEGARAWAAENLSSQTRIFIDSDSLYREPEEYDAVLIVTPHKTHPQLAVKAFQLGKAVFCDKPAGVSVSQALQMNQAAGESGQIYAMMFHQRLYAKYRRIKELMNSGKIGTVTRAMMINSRYYRTTHYHNSGSWRSSWNGEGGGALINQGQHLIDIWQWLFGVPESIYADVEFGKFNEFRVDDEATIMMRYSDRMTGVFMLTTGDAGYEERLEISGTKGKLILEDNKLTVLTYNEDSKEYGRTATCNSREQMTSTQTIEEFEAQSEPYAEMFDNFVLAYQNQNATLLVAPGTDGYKALEIVNAAYLSAWQQRKVNLPIDADEYERELEKQIEEETK